MGYSSVKSKTEGVNPMLQSQKAEEVAVKRVQMLSPLLTESLDPAKLTQIKEEI